MYTGTLIKDLESAVERAEYRRQLAQKILDRASEPTDTSLPHRDFVEQMNLKRGMMAAANLLLEESETQSERTIRTRLDSWLEGRAGCFDRGYES